MYFPGDTIKISSDSYTTLNINRKCFGQKNKTELFSITQFQKSSVATYFTQVK